MADMTHLQAGRSSVQITGSVSAIADWALAAGDSLYFPHQALLWQEPSVALDNLPMSKPWTRYRAGLPLVMATATGPGHVAFSHDTAGEVIAIPVQPGAAVDICEHRLLVATRNISYDWYESGVWYSTAGDGQGRGAGVGLLQLGMDMIDDDDRRQDDQTRWHYPMGQYLDRFSALETPGLVLIGAGGNAYVRDLAEGESVLVKPPAVLFKDPSVTMHLHVEYPQAGMHFWRSWGNRYLWLRMWGPGRIGIESSYDPHADPGTDFSSMSQSTSQNWTFG